MTVRLYDYWSDLTETNICDDELQVYDGRHGAKRY